MMLTISKLKNEFQQADADKSGTISVSGIAIFIKIIRKTRKERKTRK